MIGPHTMKFASTCLLISATVAAASVVGPFRLTVLHTNDIHDHFDVDAENCGGFARLKTALNAERELGASSGAPAIHLNAGDTFFGTMFYKTLSWEPAADFMGSVGVDAMCLGNHEFNDGPEVLASFLNSKNISNIPVVCANMNIDEEPSLHRIKNSTVLTINGRTIGIVGYLTPDTMWLDKVGKVKITNEIESLKTEVAKLKSSGVEFIIALGHSGLEMDRQVAREVDGVDIVVGGHSHSYLSSKKAQHTEPVGPYPVIEKRGEQMVPVVTAYAYSKYLGKLVVAFDSEGRLIKADGEPIFLDNSVPMDSKMNDKVDYYKSLMLKAAENIVISKNEVIGKTEVFLDGGGKCNETTLGNMVTDSFIHFNKKYNLNNNVTLPGWTDAAVAIIISSSIKTSISPNDNLKGDIYQNTIRNVLPYLTPLCKITVTGTTLLKALEHSASVYTYNNKTCAHPEKRIFGAFIQMSGMHVTYNMTKDVGSRVQSVMIQCSECKVPEYEPIIPTKQYTLITTTYLTYGGDLYTMIRDGIINKVDFGGVTETEVFEMYVHDISPIVAKTEKEKKRIEILH